MQLKHRSFRLELKVSGPVVLLFMSVPSVDF